LPFLPQAPTKVPAATYKGDDISKIPTNMSLCDCTRRIFSFSRRLARIDKPLVVLSVSKSEIEACIPALEEALSKVICLS
jgi:hypothetical protein